MTFVSDLQPQAVWRRFDQILNIPRGSKNEAAIRQWVLETAGELGLHAETDSAGNVLVRKPATPGRESAPVTVLQSHLDMVNEKNSEVEHDFQRDPIRPVRRGEFLGAAGTTLGADNGIGVATALAVAEARDLEHGPLELLFTVDEETGLTGAAALSPDLLKGQLMLNLDTEEENAIYVGCAGGRGQDISLPLRRATADGLRFLEVHLRGLKGGHSGVDIHLQRGNAIQLLARVLLSAQTIPFQLVALSGGNMRNAIPREAQALVAVQPAQENALREALTRAFQEVRQEYTKPDPEARLEVEAGPEADAVVDPASTETALRLVYALPHGVAAMSNDIPGLVETSCNLATAQTADNELRLHVSSRSSSASALTAIQRKVESVARLAGASVVTLEGYPGWQPNLDSPLLALARRVHREVLGTEPAVKAIHAGLECGIIKEKYPHLDVISIGPRIEFPHSPDERVHIGSVDRFWRFLTALLAAIR